MGDGVVFLASDVDGSPKVAVAMLEEGSNLTDEECFDGGNSLLIDDDDLDEESGIYHDEDPYWHPSHHVRHHFSDEQYYHSRDRYFPEDSYHAAGQMKYDVVSHDVLEAHALGREP